MTVTTHWSKARTQHKGRVRRYTKNKPHITDSAARKAKKMKKKAKNATQRAAKNDRTPSSA